MPTITTVDAAWDNGVTLDHAELRRADSTAFLGDGATSVRGGVVRHGPTSLAVSVDASDQVTVQAGAFVVPAATGLGVYRGSLQAATSAVALTPRNGTNPRIDLVVIQVGTGTGAVVKTIDGNPSSSPSPPSLPAQHIELGRLNVPPVGGTAVTVDSTWRQYATAIGGTIFSETAARLPGSGNQPGQPAVALDTGTQYAWDAAASKWRVTCNPGEWTSYGVTTTPETGALANATGSGRYSIVGRTMHVQMTASIIAVGTAAGALRLGLPLAASTARTAAVGGGRESQSTGVALTVTLVSSSAVSVLRYDNASVLASGRTVEAYATVELAP